jgi:hypothetical protein
MESGTYEAIFRASLSRARSCIETGDVGLANAFGLKPKHLWEDRIESAVPLIESEEIVGFKFALVRHPDKGPIRQYWQVSTTGYLRMLFEKPLNRGVKIPHCARLIPRSELWRTDEE